jgi:predicted MFS family arabinose efflux permease
MEKKQIKWMFILAAVVFTNILESMILMPLASTIKADLLMDDNQWGVVISSYLFSAFVSGILSIYFIDRFDRKRILLVLYAIFILGTLFCGLATSYETLVLARCFAGAFGGIVSSVVLAIVGDLIEPKHRGKGTGIVMAGFSSAAALGIPLGLYLGLGWTWHMPFYFIVGFSFIVLLFIYRELPAVNIHLKNPLKKNPFVILKSAFTNKNQLKALLFTCTILFGQFAIIPFLADYVEHNIGFKKEQLVWMYFFGGILTFVTNPFIGYLADRFGQLRVFLIMMSLSCVPIFFITNMGESPLPYVLLVTSLFFIFAGGRNIPGTAIVISTAAPHERGAFMNVRSAMQQLASGFAVLFGSWIVTQDGTGKYHDFEWVGYLAIVTSIISYFLLRTIRSDY